MSISCHTGRVLSVIVSIVLVISVVGGLPGTPTPVASAADIARCNGQDAVVERSAKVRSKKFRLTHGAQVDLAPGVAYRRTFTLGKVKVLKASASGSVEVSGGANWKIAKLDSKVTYSLAVAGEKTVTTSLTEEFDVPKRKKSRLYLFYRGNVQVKGQWYQLTCSRAPGQGTEVRGNVKSFNPIERSGVIVCNRNAFKKGSLRYRIAVQGGC